METRKKWLEYRDVLWERGRRSFDDLTIPERVQFAGLLIEDTSYNSAWQAIYVSDMPYRFAHYMATDNKEILNMLLNELEETAVHNKQELMTRIFDDLKREKDGK